MLKLADISAFERLQNQANFSFVSDITVFNGELTDYLAVTADDEAVGGLRISGNPKSYYQTVEIIANLIKKGIKSCSLRHSFGDARSDASWYKNEARDAIKALWKDGIIEADSEETVNRLTEKLSTDITKVLVNDSELSKNKEDSEYSVSSR